ncbi:MAG TPA: PleD family two-component system response regulator [Gemmatimonadaceae bacterium]|nr:PleD family two-component system response regulator [Gemmatimonadaceae bacterium]
MGTSASTASGTKKKILVVDDHEDNVEVLRARLESRGYDVEGAMNGQEALDTVSRWCPDLVLLDVMMPDMDGLEVVRRLKANPDLPFIPVIMQTALDSTERMVAGLEAGADDYVTKPINFAELEARVRSLLRIKKLQQELSEREKELSEANNKLTLISLTDGLTGVDNRRALEQRLHEMFEHSLRLHEPVSVVMCDIDHFKTVNDTYGHAAGDEVLKQFAGILKEEAREIDRVGRYGGEEFLLLLPGTVLDAAVTFAERLRQRVDTHTFSYEGGTLKRTVSFGVASWPHPKIKGREGMLKAADDALYVAKESGRNRVVRFDSPEFNDHTGQKAESDGSEAKEGNHVPERQSGTASLAAEGNA